jgi:hypothetical protein
MPVCIKKNAVSSQLKYPNGFLLQNLLEMGLIKVPSHLDFQFLHHKTDILKGFIR